MYVGWSENCVPFKEVIQALLMLATYGMWSLFIDNKCIKLNPDMCSGPLLTVGAIELHRTFLIALGIWPSAPCPEV